MAVDTMVDTVMAVDTTVERDPLMPNPKLPLLPNPKLKLMPMLTMVMVDTMAVDTVMVDTVLDTAMVDTDTVTITARDLLNPNPTMAMVDTDMTVDTDTADTDTAMDTVTTVELLLRIKSLEKFCLNNLAPLYPF